MQYVSLVERRLKTIHKDLFVSRRNTCMNIGNCSQVSSVCGKLIHQLKQKRHIEHFAQYSETSFCRFAVNATCDELICIRTVIDKLRSSTVIATSLFAVHCAQSCFWIRYDELY